jgi:predicted ATPase
VLESVELENFRCFRSAVVRLGPLTVLVGSNASGKTSLLRAITGHQLGNPADVRQRDSEVQARVIWHHPGGGTRYAFGVKGIVGSPPVGQYLHFDPNKMRDQRQVHRQDLLEPNGGNLASVIATMPRRQQERLAQDLARFVPVVRDFGVQPSVTPGHHRFVFQDRWNDQLWYEATEVSDGTLLALGLLALRYQSPPPSVVAIEEPEHGLHPFLLGELVSMLRQLSNGEQGSPLQIVLATQSAELLEFLEPSEVRFLTRQQVDGSVTVEEAPTDTDNWREAYAAHQQSLSSLWLSGSLGGIPTG